MKSQIQEHETHSQLLNNLLLTLRDSSEAGVEETVAFIRGNSSLDAISQHLQERRLAIRSGPASASETEQASSSADNMPSTDSETREDGAPRNAAVHRPLTVSELVGTPPDKMSPP
ncbi:hypothetical protein PV08_04794 [Exophiala spinifera]|uniref:Uncharacterized protein n=1 Tax=Exophiala spinifera TaxID=91928 RepID=A0A0D2C1R8_9EURO|nr:uncharacterized protein PV08_04794 [Exophiala spinifera]KIW17599.1 hypothetical protein PV08_04794 [Exophiala spinifera]